MKRSLASAAVVSGLVLALATPALAAGEPYGAIGGRWRELGGAAGVMGQPLTDEASGGYGGRYVLFQGGNIYWTPATGAHEVRGGIRAAYAYNNFEYGPLRYPTTGEFGLPIRPGAGEFFQGGAIYWSAATGAHAIRGGILAKWQQTGWENNLGFPTTEEYSFGSGRRQNFENGVIDWNATRGSVVYSWFRDKGWTLQTPFQIRPDFSNDFEASAAPIVNNTGTTASAGVTVTVFDNGAVVGTLKGSVSKVAPGQLVYADLYSFDDYRAWNAISFQVDYSF